MRLAAMCWEWEILQPISFMMLKYGEPQDASLDGNGNYCEIYKGRIVLPKRWRRLLADNCNTMWDRQWHCGSAWPNIHALGCPLSWRCARGTGVPDIYQIFGDPETKPVGAITSARFYECRSVALLTSSLYEWEHSSVQHPDDGNLPGLLLTIFEFAVVRAHEIWHDFQCTPKARKISSIPLVQKPKPGRTWVREARSGMKWNTNFSAGIMQRYWMKTQKSRSSKETRIVNRKCKEGKELFEQNTKEHFSSGKHPTRGWRGATLVTRPSLSIICSRPIVCTRLGRSLCITLQNSSAHSSGIRWCPKQLKGAHPPWEVR